MRVKLFLLSLVITLLLLITSITIAQEDSTCELDAAEIITVIESVCSATGNNELCYGNNDVQVDPRDNAPDFIFSMPGDMVSVSYIQSLYLSALNQLEDLWGVAQMRLVTTTSRGPQEVTLLLYGDVEVDNAVEPSVTVPITTSASINIRSIPRLNGAVLSSVTRGTELEAVGRLEDSSWIRVLIPDTEAVGWLTTDFVVPSNENASIADLDIMESDDAYFGPMQAFYINTGTNLACDNVATDGLIIQTPEGAARVTILINEVSIELISPATGTATAVVQANAVDGMTVNVISGTAVVSANGTSYHVPAGLSTNIGMTSNLTPSGQMNIPTTVDTSQLLNIPVLANVPTVNFNPTNITDAAGNNVSNGTGLPVDGNTGTNTGNANGNANGGDNGNANGSGNSNGNGSSNGGATGNANGNASGSSDGSATGGATGSATGNANGNANGNSTNGNANGNSTNGNANGNSNGNANGNSNGNANGNAKN